MDKGRKIVRICLLTMIVAAVLTGICYYYGNSSSQQDNSAGTLVKWEEEKSDGC